MQHILKVTSDNVDLRLDVFLTQNVPEVPSRSFIKKLIETNQVLVNGEALSAHYKVCEDDEVIIQMSEQILRKDTVEPENIPLDIFYEDDYLLVINKPAGMLVHPAIGAFSGTLVNALLYHCKALSDVNTQIRPGIVHRLDQETSGLILVAKDNKTHINLAKQFEKHTIKKTYLALVNGEVEFEEGMIDAPLGRDPHHRDKKAVQFDDEAKDSLTFYKVVKRKRGITLISLFPKTGRTHQLRVHLKYLGHPILGDTKYGKQNTFPRLALHAHAIGFIHPKNDCYLEFTSTPPSEFLDAVKD